VRVSKRLSALVALGVLGGLFVPGAARAQTTYQVKVGQGFFYKGVQGFSTRIYPSHMRVHRGDTIVFSNGGAGLVPNGAYPQQWLGEHWATVGQDWFYFLSDPDDGPNALKFNERVFAPGNCGAADNPCQWSGREDDVMVPEQTEDMTMHVQVTAPAGSTLWAASGPFPAVGSNLKVEVVDDAEAASTQAELDQRAEQLRRKDFEDALALDARLESRRTWHTTKSGNRVYDVFVGGVGGPIELFDSYPKEITVPRGARVQYHFMGEVEPHTATFGGSRAREVFQTGIFPWCDPDGDEGAQADNPAEFGDQGPTCPEGSVMEFDVSNRFVHETGNGIVSGPEDYENSGLKVPLYPDETFGDANPWTVRFSESSNGKGFKYICLLHGGFMGGRVIVR
jgi:hypothetical protein